MAVSKGVRFQLLDYARRCLLLCLCCLAVVSQAAPLDRSAQREIEHLLRFIEVSACQFYRNGSWHDGAEAAGHIRGKYEYLLKRGRITSAEDFIALAASKSSISGKPYTVRCGAQETTSAAWLTGELNTYRQYDAP